ncbi:MoxR-like ATPase [Paucidesulfovibrio gracilis DSM 16080]|uniref:MoxR-like ATPase n=1 Tax=Paucidesulfovibrio gracilis DSM 16080 TaxID=1121449 RepID=A0A1T4WMV7_9BACT|nr:MoxR family ATPase [Paucidesulfovibrio gracilis]SKA78549.1 MoxR-like ATPase [Paucidesulfovibrio gracilis DSM 16080]
MTPSHIVSALQKLISISQPTFLWGAPGVGKSQIVQQVAQKLHLELIDVRAVLLDPVDLRGLPHIGQDGDTVWCPPSFLPRSGKGILFLDELNAAPPLVQAACYQLILDRKLGEYALPDGWTIVAAGNRDSDRSSTHRMPSALANRLVHLDFEPNLEDWTTWARSNGLDSRIISFLQLRPKLLHDFDPQKKERAFPSPRSWEFSARILSATPDRSEAVQIIAGTVGKGAATELSGYLRIWEELPNVDEMLANPEQASIPTDPAVVCALCESLARRASRETMPELATLAKRMPTEFGVLLMRDAAFTDPSIVQTEAFEGWAVSNHQVLM